MLSPQQPDGCWSAGQITLEEGLFCLDGELIVTSTAHCPRCGDETVWPLAQW